MRAASIISALKAIISIWMRLAIFEAMASGLPTVGFGLSVLRAETAAVTAAALMVSLRTGTVAQMAPAAPVGESS